MYLTEDITIEGEMRGDTSYANFPEPPLKLGVLGEGGRIPLRL